MKKYFTFIAAASAIFVNTDAFAQFTEVDPAGELSAYAAQTSAPPPPPQMQSAPMEGDATYFYDSLKPHGSWMQVNPFGPVWRPHVAVQDSAWRPYYHGGKWVWQKNAWYWDSEYEWGWAPFHYGRWIFSNGLGWVWIPGRQWSAAWVDWRKSSTQYGWAPIPPDKSIYVGIGSTSNSGLSWGFQFGITEDRYAYMPCDNFHETVYIYDSGYGNYYGYNYWPQHCRTRDYDHDRKQRYDHDNDRPVYDKPHNPEPVRASEPSRRTTIMQQVVSQQRTTSAPRTTSSNVSRGNGSAIQQIVARTAPATSSASRPIQQATSQPRTTSSNISRGNSSSGSRSARIQDIMARTQRK